jgi:hypothetical protein
MTYQPSYWCIANIGDVSPYEHGGAFVLVDRRGTYCPELVLVESFDESSQRLAYRIQLERLTVVKNKLASSKDYCSQLDWLGISDNRYHADKLAWFGDKESLTKVANHFGENINQLIEQLVSSDAVTLAFSYRALADYHGRENFDSYPQTLTAEKAELMCDRFLAQIEESQTWHDGYYP